MLPEDIRTYLRDHRDRHLETLFELLRIPSVANRTAQPHPCDVCASWLERHMTRIGLDAEILPTEGRPCVLGQARAQRDDAPTVLIYGHYDVQPADPLDQWTTDPFEPDVRDGAIYARGANDDKGQLFAHLMALEAWQAVRGGPPVHVKVLLEGEEEIGSPHMEPFLREHEHRLAADACLVSDSEFFAEGIPSITYSLRGMAAAEICLRGPDRDLHSGIHGGAVTNPLNALAALVASMHDAQGRVTLPGFYDDVRPLDEDQRAAWDELPFDADDYARSLGVGALGGGERAFTPLERRWARPTLDVNGLVGGYAEAGSKTIIPAQASAKISMRLVPDQDPHAVIEALGRHVEAHTPPGIDAEVTAQAEARAVVFDRRSPAMSAARAACQAAFGRAPAMIRCGASVPVTEVFQRLLGLDAVMLGLGLPDDDIHSPDEHFRLDQLHRGSEASAAFLRAVGEMR